MPNAKQICISYNDAKHLLIRLKQITFGDMMSASDASFDAVVETMSILQEAVDHVEKKHSRS